jgi:hypothetical protein
MFDSLRKEIISGKGAKGAKKNKKLGVLCVFARNLCLFLAKAPRRNGGKETAYARCSFLLSPLPVFLGRGLG